MTLEINKLFELQGLAEVVKDAKMPIKTMYKFNKIFSKVESEILFYQKTFQQIVESYGKKDENGNYVYSSDGNSIEIIEDLREECIQKVEELENLTIDFEDFSFSLDELENLNLTVSQMNSLMPFIKE